VKLCVGFVILLTGILIVSEQASVFFFSIFSPTRLSSLNLPECEFLSDKSEDTMRIILLWGNHTVFEDRFLFSSCGLLHANCKVTTDPSLLDEAHAVMIQDNAWDMNVPSCRHPDQVWIYQNYEAVSSSMHPEDFLDSARHGLFNWTMSFRRDADILVSFWNSKTSIVPEVSKKPFHLAPVVWAINTCAGNNHRLFYIKELIKHVKIDIFGNCMNNTKEIFVDGLKYTYPQHSIAEIYGFYKFSLAFENTDCDDYVTEAFWSSLAVGTVPIVMGAPNVDEYAPHPHSVIKVTDFKSPSALASYLLYLFSNETAYMEYHAWRRLPLIDLNPLFLKMIKTPSPLCRLCGKLFERTPRRSIPDEHLWDMSEFCRQVV